MANKDPKTGQLLSLVSILNSGASQRENRNSPFQHRVNVGNRTSEVFQLGSVKHFYDSPFNFSHRSCDAVVAFE